MRVAVGGERALPLASAWRPRACAVARGSGLSRSSPDVAVRGRASCCSCWLRGGGWRNCPRRSPPSPRPRSWSAAPWYAVHLADAGDFPRGWSRAAAHRARARRSRRCSRSISIWLWYFWGTLQRPAVRAAAGRSPWSASALAVVAAGRALARPSGPAVPELLGRPRASPGWRSPLLPHHDFRYTPAADRLRRGARRPAGSRGCRAYLR